MSSQAMSSKQDRRAEGRVSPRSWNVGNDLQWRTGFSGIGSNRGAGRGALGTSGILRPDRRDRTEIDGDDTSPR